MDTLKKHKVNLEGKKQVFSSDFTQIYRLNLFSYVLTDITNDNLLFKGSLKSCHAKLKDVEKEIDHRIAKSEISESFKELGSREKIDKLKSKEIVYQVSDFDVRKMYKDVHALTYKGEDIVILGFQNECIDYIPEAQKLLKDQSIRNPLINNDSKQNHTQDLPLIECISKFKGEIDGVYQKIYIGSKEDDRIKKSGISISKLNIPEIETHKGKNKGLTI